ncbi:MAG: type II secretion system protein GspJ [Nitrospinota bacterium]
MMPIKNQTETSGATCENGFTLVEILVAVGIVSVIFTFIFGVLTSTLAASKEAAEKMEIMHTGRFFINRITGDLTAASLMLNSGNGAFIGKDLRHSGKSMDELHFTAFAHTHLTRRPQIDQSEIGYYFEYKEDGATLLKRREADVIDSIVDSGGESFPITGKVNELKIRYLAREGWTDSWDSTLNKSLPKAVSVEITLKDSGRSYFFSNIVRLPV